MAEATARVLSGITGLMAPQKDETRRPTLLIVMLVLIVLTLVTFLILRPRGPGASQQTNPAAPAGNRQ